MSILDYIQTISGILASLSFVGGFIVSLYALRKPKTRAHIQLALAKLATSKSEEK